MKKYKIQIMCGGSTAWVTVIARTKSQAMKAAEAQNPGCRALDSIAKWRLLLYPIAWGLTAGFVGTIIGFFFPFMVGDTGNLSPPFDAIYFGFLATILGVVAGCVYAIVLRVRA